MIRVLHSVSYMHRGGVENFLMNYYRNIDRNLIQFDFLCNQQIKGAYDDEIIELGGRIFYRPKEITEDNYASFWRDFLISHPEIQILHTHNGAKQYYPLKGALDACVKVRIAHGHCSDIEHDKKYDKRKELISQLPQVATHCFACSEKAGKFFFGDCWNDHGGRIIANAVNKNEFQFDESLRKKMRADLGVSDNYVIGHIGRFDQQKNHERLLKIFLSIFASNKNARLLLVGDGTLLDCIKTMAKELQIEHAVIFAGAQEDASLWYQAMDVLVMPSLFEGVPLVSIEAQASGLPCVFSKAIPESVGFGANVRFLDLEQGDDEWCSAILSYRYLQGFRTSRVSLLPQYDISNAAMCLQDTYIKLLEELSV